MPATSVQALVGTSKVLVQFEWVAVLHFPLSKSVALLLADVDRVLLSIGHLNNLAAFWETKLLCGEGETARLLISAEELAGVWCVERSEQLLCRIEFLSAVGELLGGNLDSAAVELTLVLV